jgi:hypothetical protein
MVRPVPTRAPGSKLLAIATPGVFGPAYFRDVIQVLAAAARAPPDPAALGEAMRRHGLPPNQARPDSPAIPSAEPPELRSFMEACVSAKAAHASALWTSVSRLGCSTTGFRIAPPERAS